MSVDLVVLGLGYVGLPLVNEAVRSGLSVVGFDINSRAVEGLNAGLSYVDDLSDADVVEMTAGGFRATTDEAVIADARTAVICVPTLLADSGGPNLGPVTSAGQAVSRHLQPGMLVILESTMYPGTTEEELTPLLSEAGLMAGEDFHVAFSPEHIDLGNPTYGMRATPKVVGGLTTECTVKAVQFYEQFVDTVVPAKGTREAEMAKLLENTDRHINIALVNEITRFTHELDFDTKGEVTASGAHRR